MMLKAHLLHECDLFQSKFVFFTAYAVLIMCAESVFGLISSHGVFFWSQDLLE